MPNTTGYIGTIEVGDRKGNRIWFSLTDLPTGSDWVKIGSVRAWFTMDLESDDRPVHMAQLTLLTEAMRNRLQVRVRHGGAASFHRKSPNDTFEVTRVRVLRDGLNF